MDKKFKVLMLNGSPRQNGNIALAFPRLTLGGRPFPRKPWIFDGQDSHLSLVTYSDILTTDTSTRPCDRASTAYSKLLYRSFLIPQLRHTV